VRHPSAVKGARAACSEIVQHVIGGGRCLRRRRGPVRSSR
jgi:hypothetical protein